MENTQDADEQHADVAHSPPIRILFVFAHLGGEDDTLARLLARALVSSRFRIEAVACRYNDGVPEQSHARLAAAGVPVDTTPYHLSFEDTVTYLADLVPGYDLVVSCQNVADIYPALERLHRPPPLIEHGRLVTEALAGPKHLTARYVGASAPVRDAAAARLPGREHHAVEIPSMVEMAAVGPANHAGARAAFRPAPRVPLIGWVGQLGSQKSVADFLTTAALVHAQRPQARFVLFEGANAAAPDRVDRLRAQAETLGLAGVLAFPGDRPEAAGSLSGLDACWLADAEDLPSVVEAGAAGSAVVTMRGDDGTPCIDDGVSGLLVPRADPPAVAAALLRLLANPALARRFGAALRATVAVTHAVEAVAPRWEALIAHVLAERAPPARPTGLFRSFLQGGFECSTHRRAHDRARVDVIAASHHDIHAEADYRALAAHGLLTVRDGLRWHLIEREPGLHDWSSLDAQLAAARATETQVIWDLLHYGWPDDIDIWTPAFVERFAAFAAAAARYIGPARAGERRFYAPVNEVSFLAWAGGDAAYLNPFARGRGHELKVQLARASIAAMEAILAIDPAARFVHPDPAIRVIADPARPWYAAAALGHSQAQYQGWDMIAGRAWPQIGGRPALLDIVGINFYHNNQWRHGGPTLSPHDPLARPLRHILASTWQRYGRPIFIAETGIEGDARAEWLRYVLAEVSAAIAAGVPVEGVCLYPVLDHPGWDNDRYCPNGLLRWAADAAGRTAHEPLAEVLREWAGTR